MDIIAKFHDELPFIRKIVSNGRYPGLKGKAWTIVSEYCRMRDFILWRVCASCYTIPSDWRHFDAGHYISMGGHGAFIGFWVENIHGQCPYCNMHSSQHTGVHYHQELERRGIDPEKLRRLAQKSVKADDLFWIEKIREVYVLFKKLKEENPGYDYPKYLD